jgi:hypothetical protein
VFTTTAAAGRCDRSGSSDTRISIIACLWRWSGQTRIRVRRIARRIMIRRVVRSIASTREVRIARIGSALNLESLSRTVQGP